MIQSESIYDGQSENWLTESVTKCIYLVNIEIHVCAIDST